MQTLWTASKRQRPVQGRGGIVLEVHLRGDQADQRICAEAHGKGSEVMDVYMWCAVWTTVISITFVAVVQYLLLKGD